MESAISFWKDAYLKAGRDYTHAVTRTEQDRALFALRRASGKLGELGVSMTWDGTFEQNAPQLEKLSKF